MSFRLATFNVENLMNRFDFSGYRNQLQQDRTLALFHIRDEAEYRLLEQARTVAHTDDTRQFGLLGMRERAKRLEGRFELSGPPGEGTTVRIVIPLEAAAPAAPPDPVIV